SQRLAEEIAAEKAGGLAGNGRHDHLQRLQHNEEQGRQNPPFPEHLLEIVLVHIEADEEAVRRGIGDDEPGAGARDERDHAPYEEPPVAGDQPTHRIVADALAEQRRRAAVMARSAPRPGRAARTNRISATNAAGSDGAAPALERQRNTNA